MPSDFNHRIWLIYALLAIQVIWAPLLTFGQNEEEILQVKERYDRTFGSDYNLLNGRQYSLLLSNTSHPFLSGELARPGRLVLNGTEYEGVLINYDLYQQAVILRFISHTGEIRYLVLNREAVDAFSLDGKVFRNIAFQGKEEQYMQVIEAEEKRFIISWNKNMNYSASMNQTPYNYSRPSRRIFLECGGEVHPVGSRSDFLDLFEEPHRAVIRQYLRKERIRFRSATDLQMSQLLEFCNQTEEGIQ